ncbi:DUF6873 family GME fold protein [Clostridium fallax]|uniref:DUF6873 domain-containing protein n=1 Tax=Clostridium fallax TaxID=1533 RepID=A0A1M4WNZ6_9CLOT|nr:hypothetical protein [Clostridium fallax]SHE82956.1 hypothetical protein SAMN05443638_11332 [Clostridium fallax]SQB06251.1 Uncharacterised protein [Clostridium fallax]
MTICFVDYKSTECEINNLKKLNLDVIKVPKCSKVYSSIDGHPDIQIHITYDKKIIIQKDIEKSFLKELEKRNLDYILTSKSLENKYPNNIMLNGLSTKNFFIHNLKFTSKELLESENHKTLINIKQGYTKCSCAFLGNNIVITSDKGIYNKLTEKNSDVLLLPPGDISLPGLNYGFIGGCCGLLPNNKIAFFGSLEKYLYGKEVLNFLNKYDLEPIYLSDGHLIDRGSILVY